MFRQVRSKIRYYRRVMNHPRTPRLAKWLIGAAVGYLVIPIDLIPDAIPVLGHLDDAIVVPLLIVLAMWLVPPQVRVECRRGDGHDHDHGTNAQ